MKIISNEKLPAKQIINCVAYSMGRRVADVELDNVHEVLKEPDQFVWIALHEPSEEMLARVQQEFRLRGSWRWKTLIMLTSVRKLKCMAILFLL